LQEDYSEWLDLCQQITTFWANEEPHSTYNNMQLKHHEAAATPGESREKTRHADTYTCIDFLQ